MNPTGRRQTPRYVRLAAQLREKIEAGELLPGDRVPSFSEMRRRGISQLTLERAHALLAEQGLIRREVGRGTFITHPHERKNTNIIGFLGAGFGNTFLHSTYWTHLIEGIRDVTRLHDLRLLLLEHTSASGWDQVDGVFLGTLPTAEVLAWLPRNVPCVVMLEWAENLAVISANPDYIDKLSRAGSVTADDYSGARLLTENLLGLGHRRISYLLSAPTLNNTMIRRLAGYRDALQAEGVAGDERLIYDLGSQPQTVDFREAGRASMKAWLAAGWRELGSTAVLAQNDTAALGVMEALQEAGLRIPNDVSVAGFDGTELGEYCSPRLTSVEVPLRQIGSTSAEMMWRLTRGDEAEHLTLPVRLRERASTAPPPAALRFEV